MKYGRAVQRLAATAVLAGMIIVFAAVSPMAGQTPATEETPAVPAAGLQECSELAALLIQLDERNSRELRQIKRDLAALTKQVEQPGLSEILGGIGYILGLFGVAAYVASRKKSGGGGD